MNDLERFDSLNQTTEVDSARALMERIEAYKTGEAISSVIYSISDGADGTLSVGNVGYQRGVNVYPSLADAIAQTNAIAIGIAINEAIVTATTGSVSSARPLSNEKIKRESIDYVMEVEYFETTSQTQTFQGEVDSLVEELRDIIDPDNCLGPWHGYTRVYPG